MYICYGILCVQMPGSGFRDCGNSNSCCCGNVCLEWFGAEGFMQWLDKRDSVDMWNLMLLSKNDNLAWLCRWVFVACDVIDLVFSDICIKGMEMIHRIVMEVMWL